MQPTAPRAMHIRHRTGKREAFSAAFGGVANSFSVSSSTQTHANILQANNIVTSALGLFALLLDFNPETLEVNGSRRTKGNQIKDAPIIAVRLTVGVSRCFIGISEDWPILKLMAPYMSIDYF